MQLDKAIDYSSGLILSHEWTPRSEKETATFFGNLLLGSCKLQFHPLDDQGKTRKALVICVYHIRAFLNTLNNEDNIYYCFNFQAQ